MSKLASYVAAAVAVIVILALVYWGIGSLASWVLAYFGVKAPWTICAGGFFLLSCIFGRGVKVKK